MGSFSLILTSAFWHLCILQNRDITCVCKILTIAIYEHSPCIRESANPFHGSFHSSSEWPQDGVILASFHSWGNRGLETWEPESHIVGQWQRQDLNLGILPPEAKCCDYILLLCNVQLCTEPLAHMLPALVHVLSIMQMKKWRIPEMQLHPR